MSRITRKYLRLAANIIRSIFLLITVIAVFTFWVWNEHPEWVNRIDGYIINRYEEYYKSKHEEIVGLINSGNLESALDQIVVLKMQMGDVRKLDRLASLYTATREEELYIYRKKGDSNKAMEVTKELVDFNSNAYYYWLEYGKELLKKPELIKKAENAFQRAHQILPSSIEVTKEYAGLLLRLGRRSEAAQVVRECVEAHRYLNFEFFWSGNSEPFAESRKAITEVVAPKFGKNCTLKFQTAGASNVNMLRLDLPAWTAIDMRIEAFYMYTDVGKVTINLDQLHIILNQVKMEADGELAASYSNDPYLYFSLPEAAKEIHEVEVVCSFGGLPENLMDLLKDYARII